jgi:hypothetical protein
MITLKFFCKRPGIAGAFARLAVNVKYLFIQEDVYLAGFTEKKYELQTNYSRQGITQDGLRLGSVYNQ